MALFLFAKQQKTDFSFFQETHSVIDDASLWKADGVMTFGSQMEQKEQLVLLL
jgi:hypothetical protein